MKKSLSIVLCLVLTAAMLLGGCSQSGGGEATAAPPTQSAGNSEEVVTTGEPGYERKTAEDSFTLGASEEPDTLDPANAQLMSGWAVTAAVHDNLITMDPDTGEYVYVLAESMEYTDDTTLVIKIRPGITFSNGNPLISEDVLFTFENLAASSRFATNYACIDFENSVCVDETTLEVKLLNPYAPLLAYMCHPSAGVVSKAYYDEVGVEVFGRNPVGTGPFLFESWVSGDRVTLTRNDDYWGDKPVYTTATVRFITESTTRMIEFETGGIDASIDLASSDIERMKKGEVPNSVLYSVVSEKISRICMYEGYEPFQDYRVRQAIAHAIDMEAVVEVAYGSAGNATANVFPADCKYYEEFSLYEYDTEKALALLEEAGYPNGEGLALSASIASGTSDSKALEVIQSMLGQVGIKVDIELTEVATAIANMRSGASNFSVINSTTTSRDPDQALSNMKSTSVFLIAASNDEYLNERLSIGATVIDDATRETAYKEVARYIYDNAITIPVAVTINAVAVRDYVDNFSAYSSGLIDLRTVTFK